MGSGRQSGRIMERTGTKLDLPDEDCEAVLRMAGKDGILKQAISAIEDRAAKFQETGRFKNKL